MDVPRAARALAPVPGNRPAVPRDWFPYLNGTSQGEPVLPVPSLSRGAKPKEYPRTPGRTVIDCRLEIADCGFEIAKDRVRQSKRW